jgi:hypothetical protein
VIRDGHPRQGATQPSAIDGADRCDGVVRSGTAPTKLHPVIRSYEPGEDWWWCYADDLFFAHAHAQVHPAAAGL